MRPCSAMCAKPRQVFRGPAPRSTRPTSPTPGSASRRTPTIPIAILQADAANPYLAPPRAARTLSRFRRRTPARGKPAASISCRDTARFEYAGSSGVCCARADDRPQSRWRTHRHRFNNRSIPSSLMSRSMTWTTMPPTGALANSSTTLVMTFVAGQLIVDNTPCCMPARLFGRRPRRSRLLPTRRPARHCRVEAEDAGSVGETAE